MSKRRKITAGPHRSFFGNVGEDSVLQHFQESLDEFDSASAVTQGEDICAKEHHGSSFSFGKGRTEATSVAANQIQLKFFEFGIRNANIRKLPKSGVHTIDDLAFGKHPLDDRACRANPVDRRAG